MPEPARTPAGPRHTATARSSLVSGRPTGVRRMAARPPTELIVYPGDSGDGRELAEFGAREFVNTKTARMK